MSMILADSVCAGLFGFLVIIRDLDFYCERLLGIAVVTGGGSLVVSVQWLVDENLSGILLGRSLRYL